MSNITQVSREEDLTADEVEGIFNWVSNRFHVMKLVNDTLNKIRRGVGVTAKGSKYLLLKNNQYLTGTDQEQIEKILSQSACLRFAYEMKQEF
jgi:transposase